MNQILRLTKIFTFEAAHALWQYDGKCKHIHGHSYVLHVTVQGLPSLKIGDPKRGMVIDYSILKKIVEDAIINRYDHSLMLNNEAPYEHAEGVQEMYDNVYRFDFQPSSENMVIHFAELLTPILPDGVELFSLKLYETQTAFVEWFSTDNEKVNL